MMKRRDRRRRKIKRLAVTIIILGFIAMIALPAFTRRGASIPQQIALEIIGTGQSAATAVIAGITGIWDGYIALRGVREENIRLRKELARCRREIADYSEAAALNIRLNKLLELKEEVESPKLTARIIGRDPSDWFRVIIIDRGKNDGIHKGMPAITVEGMVGQVLSASPDKARVLLGIDPNSAVDGLIQHCRAQGIIKGDGESYVFNYVMKNLDIRENDLIVTSGLSGVFPKGIPVGRVTRVTNTARGMFQEVKVAPVVNFNQLEYVMILLRENPLTED